MRPLRRVRVAGPAVALAALAFAVAASLSLRALDPAEAGGDRRPIIGAKIYDYSGSLPGLFDSWRSAGINTAFVSAGLASRPEFMSQARARGVAVFIIFPVFLDAEELAARPDLYAITADGSRAEDDWVKFVCPTRRDYLDRKIALLGKLVRETDADGVSLDFIRTFVFWEKVYPDRSPASLPNSCFDESCLKTFGAATGVEVPSSLAGTAAKAGWILAHHADEWTGWKCGLIAGIVESLAGEARRIKPDIKINVHAVPWRAGDFGDAARVVAGQDLALMARHADYVSPMCYHHMVKRPPAWIASVVGDVARRVDVPVLPSIQVKEAYLAEPESPEEFREALTEALKPPSAGVVFWNWPSLAESPEKLAAVRTVLAAGGSRPVGKTGRESER